MKEVTLPSGAILKITLAPFDISKALYQAVLEEAKALKVDPSAQIDVNLFKDLFCAGFSSKKIESCLNECMKRATYNDKKINNPQEVFEPVEARQDYMNVLFEVAQENIMPFTKSLSAQYSAILSQLKGAQK